MQDKDLEPLVKELAQACAVKLASMVTQEQIPLDWNDEFKDKVRVWKIGEKASELMSYDKFMEGFKPPGTNEPKKEKPPIMAPVTP